MVRLLGTEPAEGDGDVCVDTPLRLTFDRVPVVGTGTIEVWRDDGVLADRIDLSDPGSASKNIGGAVTDTGRPHFFCYDPIRIAGRRASIEPHLPLEYGREYRVLVDEHVFPGFPGLRWSFRTRLARPDPSAGRLVVAGTGAADFRTVQGAIDAVPTGNQRRVVVDVLPGTYPELVYVRAEKPRITVRGRARREVVLRYRNNEIRNGKPPDPESRCPNRRLDLPDRYNCWRASFGVEASDFALENITLRNETSPGGGQAEAFRGNAERIRLEDVTLASFQDTLRLQGTGYVVSSRIEGDVDFVWGVGAVFLRECELRSVRPGPLAQLRNGTGRRGAVFRDCRLTRNDDVPGGSCLLARTDAAVFPDSEVVFLDTTMDRHIAPVGWEIRRPERFTGRFLEHGSRHPDGSAVHTRDRHRLASDASLSPALLDWWRDPRHILQGWDPV